MVPASADPAVRHTYSMRRSVVNRIKDYARARGWSEAMVVNEAVREYLWRYGSTMPPPPVIPPVEEKAS